MAKMTKDQALAVLAVHGLDTRDGALAAYGDKVAAKWGESEREHGIRQKRGKSHGLIANSVVVFDVNNLDEGLRTAVKAILTEDDWAELRKGG